MHQFTSTAVNSQAESVSKNRTPFESRSEASAAQNNQYSCEHASRAGSLSQSDPAPFHLAIWEKRGEGVRACNTDPPKLSFLAAGLDWLKLYVFGSPVAAGLLGRLETLKRKVRDESEPAFIDLAGLRWTVEPYSDGKGLNNLSYVLTSAGLRLALGTREGSGPVAMIEAQGRYCGGLDPRKVHSELKNIVCKAGVKPTRFTVSRLDIHGDVIGIPVSRIMKAFHDGKIVKRAKDWVMHGSGLFEHGTGMTFGKRGQAVHARIYDKVTELERDFEKQAAYLSAHRLEEMPEVATRVEFEMTGEFFRENWRCSNSDEVFESLGTMTQYLMEKWLRVCSHVDRNNTQLAKPAAWWKWLGDKMAEQMKAFAPRGDLPKMPPNVDRLKRQLLGITASLVGRLGQGPPDVRHGLTLVASMFSEEDNQRFRDRVENRVTEFDQREAEWIRRSSHALADAG